MPLFSRKDTILIVNNKPEYIQKILDYDYIISRPPSVEAIIHTESSYQKLFYGAKEILIPVYKELNDKIQASVAIDLSSYRSAYNSVKKLLELESIKIIVMIAEGVPERDMKELIRLSKLKNKLIIGPATFGAITVGALRAGVVGGDYDNIIKSRLYSPGSVGIVTRSGGLLNEMFRIVARNTDGTAEGVAVGGDVFPGSTMLDHIIRMNNDPSIKIILAIGEIGGKEEYKLAELIRDKIITKPIITWIVGASAELFPWNVQFGHAAARANTKSEGAREKMIALKDAGAIVPNSFNEIELELKKLANKLNLEKTEAEYRALPMDFKKARDMGLVRRSTSIVSTISKEVDGEISYKGKKVSELIDKDITDVIGYLWFGEEIPNKFKEFLRIAIILLADHGPNVAGAHNAIVAARAGKDLISSLASGVLTIGPRFGGAIDEAMKYFYLAVKRNITPAEFVNEMKMKGINIPGIGHRIKSKYNPDKRVELLKEFAQRELSIRKYLNYALEVEKETLKKSEKLILNVDGAIAAILLDMFEELGYNVEEMLEIGYGNAIFVLARSIGIIGHIMDQKRLKQPLYRHPDDDVLFV